MPAAAAVEGDEEAAVEVAVARGPASEAAVEQRSSTSDEEEDMPIAAAWQARKAKRSLSSSGRTAAAIENGEVSDEAAGNGDDGASMPLEEVPYAAAALDIPPGGENPVAAQDEQHLVAEQLMEAGAHAALANGFEHPEDAEDEAMMADAAPEVPVEVRPAPPLTRHPSSRTPHASRLPHARRPCAAPRLTPPRTPPLTPALTPLTSPHASPHASPRAPHASPHASPHTPHGSPHASPHAPARLPSRLSIQGGHERYCRRAREIRRSASPQTSRRFASRRFARR